MLSFLGQGASNGLRLVSNIILARLLFPEAFGLMALVNVAVTGLEMLSDLGVKISIIQNKRGDEPDFLNTAWTISIIRGVSLFVLGSMLAWPYALAYEEPRLMAMVQATALMALINGVASTKLAQLNRHIALGRIVVFNLTSQVSGLAMMVGFAYFHRSPWALVVGTLGTASVNCLLSHLATPGPRNHLRWDPEAARTIVSFGKWIFASTAITFLANYGHTLVLGKLVQKDVLGVYNNAGSLANLPQTIGGQVIGSVLLPALSEAFRKDHNALVAAFERARSLILPLAGVVSLSVILASPAFFTYFYDARYRDATWIAPLLAFSAWFVFLQEASGRALQAMGDAKSLFIANTTKVIVLVGCSLLGFQWNGLFGFILGTILGALAGQAALIMRLRAQRVPSGWMDFKYTSVLLALGLGGTYAPKLLSAWTGLDAVALSIPIGILILGPIGLWSAKRVKNAIKKPAT
ncbi:MAG: oligosaccharide flippase family protein [Myxococcota bacterium]